LDALDVFFHPPTPAPPTQNGGRPPRGKGVAPLGKAKAISGLIENSKKQDEHTWLVVSTHLNV